MDFGIILVGAGYGVAFGAFILAYLANSLQAPVEQVSLEEIAPSLFNACE